MKNVIKYYQEYGINWVWLYPINGDEHFRIHKGNTREEVDNAYYKYFQYASTDKKYDPRRKHKVMSAGYPISSMSKHYL